MASSGLPSGAFLTTLNGRRCTAVPRVAAVSTRVSSVAAVTTTSSLTSRSTNSSTSSSTTAIAVVPSKGLAAAPAADIDAGTEVAEQSSTSTMSPFLVTTTTISSGSVRIAQAQGSESGSLARPSSPSPDALPTSDATSQPFAAVADITPSQASVEQSSQADASVTAPAVAETPAASSESTPAESLPPDLPLGPVATPLLTTIESLPTPTDATVADSTGSTSADAETSAIPNSDNNAVQSTVAVAGGVIGGVVAISVLAFFIWWWRRRAQRKRRSTLLTPLDVVPSYDRDEKGGYVISRGSIGPTPVAVKVKAALGHNYKKIRGHIRNRTAPSVNLDRGTSQFMDPAMRHSRSSSGIIGAEPTTTDRLKDWWSGLGKKFNRRNSSAQEKPPGVTQEKKVSSSQPDFLTLLNMDDGELDREAQRRRDSIARVNGRANSSDNFLGGLNLSFGNDNPFSDANAIAHTSAKPAPLAVSQANAANPFSDANAITNPPPTVPKPTTYVADIRRSRSNSTTAGRQPSTIYNYSNANRDSAGSLRSMATATTTNQRNKFRSDPFDLERPELLAGGNSNSNNNRPVIPGSRTSSTAATAGSTPSPSPSPSQQQQPTQPMMTMAMNPPARARNPGPSPSRPATPSSPSTRSGVSAMSADNRGSTSMDWSDPGPDVGPAAAGRWVGGGGASGGGASGGGESGRVNGGRLNGGSLGSLGSVGKAM
ncbi:hypothetical protein CHGG_00419 [Chaetomium globosum CBS 148.51]|uniref:Uncharacterized protein n=1 Tax=Chaetomium globosum (strain ATCC 6205 / CBS 148.51 / DSM 1962 / NBRC 6347 / NRRL 1970) TaxID=306901 RepID=Q2HH85_CHAGB|nr:uncharacterized protein CHGG_00419 [Chaetomium globosum CBS 148.51]EAQ92184.1 hypothetical protein CHGG_00419 [Chaetomium globosum CBS 148.51]